MNDGAEQPADAQERQSLPHAVAGRIVAGGGWVEGKTHYGRPKMRLCTIASVIWIFPTLGAAWIVGSDLQRWFRAESFLEGLRVITFEQWIALVILAAHPVFAGLAWHYRRTEPLKEEKSWVPNPDDDLHKLR